MPRIPASNLLAHATHWPLQPHKHEWETILPTPGYISLEENVLPLESVNGICPGYFLRVLRGTWTQKSKNQTDLISNSYPRVAVWHQTLWFVATCAKLDIWNYLPGEIHCLFWSGSLCISALNWHPCNVRRIWRDYAIFSPNRFTYACVNFPVLKWDVQRWLIYTLSLFFIYF